LQEKAKAQKILTWLENAKAERFLATYLSNAIMNEAQTSKQTDSTNYRALECSQQLRVNQITPRFAETIHRRTVTVQETAADQQFNRNLDEWRMVRDDLAYTTTQRSAMDRQVILLLILCIPREMKIVLHNYTLFFMPRFFLFFLYKLQSTVRYKFLVLLLNTLYNIGLGLQISE